MAKNTYIDKTEIKTLSQRSNLWGAYLVFHVWATIIATGAMAVIWPNVITIPLAILIIGSRQHGMSVLVHEAAHGTLFANKAINDFAGQYILGVPYGGDMRSYRRYHLRHHKYAQSENDPDLGLSAKFPVTKASLRRKFIRDITGQTYLRLRLAQMQPGKMEEIPGSDAFQKTSPWPSLIVNALMFGALAALGYWWAYFVLWLLPLFTWFYAVIRLRNIAEHAMTTNDDNPLTHARTTRAGWLARIFFAPYYVNYHVEHHAYMYVPCYMLPKLHRRLIALGHGEEMETKPNYRAVLRAASTA